MQFETKLAVILRDDLAVWQKTNVTAFLVSGIAATAEGVVGAPHRELFETGQDEANRAQVATVSAEELDLVGIAFRADRKVVDKVVDRLRFHP